MSPTLRKKSSHSFSVPKTLLSLLEAAPTVDAHSTASGSPYIGAGSPYIGGSGVSTPMRGQQTRVNAIRAEIIDGIEEIKDEISQVDDQIASAAEVQIHPMDYDHNVPYIFVPSRAELGAAAKTKRPTSVVMVMETASAAGAKKAEKKEKDDEDDGEDFKESYDVLVKLVQKETARQAFWA
ncbi:hypothetical protein BN1723_013502 [Verticillium longisporum]|uniref:Ribosomal protein eL8/eL30/eS12/Gadd45 domain-containing protein n=1 Tax=Verticillium longisporum TaxID=100787 RepID=A0A0G4LSU5_VERLO|nr:hypothetical protein BN1723_013502 [Verticillium longisporum]